MRAFVLAFLLAAVSSVVLTPIVRRVALRIGAVSRPGGRHVNERAVPRLGGIAIALAFFVPLATIFPLESTVAAALRSEWRRVAGLLVGALVLAGVGVLDDTRNVRALHKFLVQIAMASLAYAVGFHIDAIQLPLVGSVSMGVFAGPVTVLWIVGIVNAINLIDGLDGLAAGIVFFAGVTNFVVALVSQNTFVCALMATMLGAVLGFLFFNFNPARIFMGDSGSYFLGFLLGTTSVVGGSQTASTAVSLLVPILALGVPIFDTFFAMVRRYLERRPFFSPDRGHVHHRLLDMGVTHRRAVLLLYGISMVFTIAAIGVSLGHNWQVGVAILIASIVMVALIRFLGYFEYVLLMRRQRARLTDPDTEALRRILPEAVVLFEATRTDEDVWGALEQLLGKAHMAAAELVPIGLDAHIDAWKGVATRGAETMASARFPIGEDHLARAELRFRWCSPRTDVSPQTAVLLQVLVDVVAAALMRVNSQFAPMVVLDRVEEPDRISTSQSVGVES